MAKKTTVPIVTELAALPSAWRGAAVALGNFDGVHKGHAAVIAQAVAAAKNISAPALVISFEPHPRRFFRPQDPPFRLTPLPAKAQALAQLGVDGLVALTFDAALAQMSATQFVEQVLQQALQVRSIAVGYDFVFGHNRVGNAAFLQAQFKDAVTEVPAMADANGRVWSSTLVRDYLLAGDTRAAAHVLGRWWSMAGVVEHGDKRGRQLGFPTANINMGEYLRPHFGVYAARINLNGVAYNGVANIGQRPTVGGTAERLEVHIFDFDQDIYGEVLTVELIEFLRPEQKFANLDHLKQQIAEDAASSRNVLKAMLDRP